MFSRVFHQCFHPVGHQWVTPSNVFAPPSCSETFLRVPSRSCWVFARNVCADVARQQETFIACQADAACQVRNVRTGIPREPGTRIACQADAACQADIDCQAGI